MIKDIKRIRIFNSLIDIINRCDNSHISDTSYWFYKHNELNYFMFYVSDDGDVTINHENLILVGVDETLKNYEIEQFLYERFYKGNKKE